MSSAPAAGAAVPQQPPKPPVMMRGGAREQVLDLVRKYAQPLEFYFGVLIVLGIVYVGQIPDSYTYQANSLLGRLLLFGATILVADMYSWVYALLMAVFAVLVIAVAPRNFTEGFHQKTDADMGDTDVKLVTQKQRWWVEQVLRENPLGIEEDKVRTQAIQDSSSGSSNSTTSSR